MKSYSSKVYIGKNFDAVVKSYFGSNSFPSELYEVLYRVHTDDINDPFWSHRVEWVYASKSSAMKRAKQISLY